MARQKNDYFALMEEQVGFCVKASELLCDIVKNYSANSIKNQRDQMHSVEQKADDVYHDILLRLSSEFITPIDQEDILRLVQIFDDVTDAIDEVILDFYMYHIAEMPAFAGEFVKLVERCVRALCEAVRELKTFKKPHKLRSLLVNVNSIEGEADAVYVKAIHSLFIGKLPNNVLIGDKAIYESLENCCDLCEHAADLIEQIIIKNS